MIRPSDFPALHGAWRLVGWTIRQPDGREAEPYGAGATGLLVYTPDGWMSGQITEPDRPPLSASSPRRAPLDEQARAYASYFAYAGRWHVEGGTVVHRVTQALNPAMVGSEQRRDMRFEGDTLTLSADDVDAKGITRHHRLVWRRDHSTGDA